MNASTLVAATLWSALLLTPAASALVADVPPVPGDLVGHVSAAVPAPAPPLALELPVRAQVQASASGSAAPGAGAEADVGVSASPAPALVPPPEVAAAPASSAPPPSAGERLSDVAAPAAVPALLALLLGALALGVDGFRSFMGRGPALFTRLGRALAGALGGAALFSRLQRGSLLENPVRARVHDAIALEPGLCLTDVTARAGIAWGTTVHHVRRLEQHGLVVSTTRLGRRRYFLSHAQTSQEREAVSVVMHPTARRIAHLVSQRPGIDQTGICQVLGLNNPAASKHLGHFASQGLVLSQRAGRTRTYHPAAALREALQLAEGHPAPAPHASATSSLVRVQVS